MKLDTKRQVLLALYIEYQKDVPKMLAGAAIDLISEIQQNKIKGTFNADVLFSCAKLNCVDTQEP